MENNAHSTRSGRGGPRDSRRSRPRAVLPILALAGLALALSAGLAPAAKKGYTYETDPIRLGMKALEESKLDEAGKHFDEAIANEYQVAKAHFGQAEILRRMGSYGEAEPLYRLAGTEVAMEKGSGDFPERPAGLGLVLLRLGRIEEAEKEFEKALALKGNLWEAQYGMARIALSRNEFDKAEKQLDKGSREKGLKEGEDLYHFGMGLLLFSQAQALSGPEAEEKLAAAEKEALKAFTMYPNDPEYGTLVADIYTKRNAPTLAIDAYERALATPGATPTARVLHSLGVLYEHEKRYNDAIAKYREAAQADSNFAPAWRDMAELFALADQHDNAAGAYLRFLQLEPGDSEALVGLARSCMEIKRYAQALDAAQTAYSKDSTNVEVRLILARAAFQTKDKTRAEAMYATVTDTTMLEAEDYVRLGQFKLEAQDLEGAERDLKSAVARDSLSAEAYYYLGFVALKGGRDAAAIENFSRAIAIAPENASFHLNQGIAYLRQKQVPDAIRSFRSAVRLNPTAAQGHVYLAQSLMSADSLAAAVGEYQAAREIEPDNLAALKGLGLSYLKRKSYGQAVEVLRRASEVDPNDADAWAWLGQALALENRTPEALKALEKALAIRPDHPTAIKLKQILLDAQKGQQAGAPPGR